MGIKFGIIGCGRQAPKHISGLVAHGGIEIAVADLEPERAEALAASQPVTALASVDQIFADPDIAAVSICTPPSSHGELIRRAIAAGKHFICEKPLTADLAEARSLMTETERAGVVGMVGYIYRFAPAFELAAQALAGASSGGEAAALGRVSSAYFRLGGPGSHDAWQHMRASNGGAINEMLVHMADLALWYFGPMADARLIASEVREPVREIGGQRIDADAEDWVLARMRSRSGVDIVIQADLATPTFIQFAEIHGDNGSFFGSIQSEMPTYVHCLEGRAGFAQGREPFSYGPRNLFEAQMGLFLDCIAGKARLDKCTLADSVRLLDVLEMMRGGSSAGEQVVAGDGIPAP